LETVDGFICSNLRDERLVTGRVQGCQMAYFQNKNPNLGRLWRVLEWKMLVYFISIWSILRPFSIFFVLFGKFYNHLDIFPRFGVLYQEKSGNPGQVIN
jgi:hypothetical protein